jgi:hypothetical protein
LFVRLGGIALGISPFLTWMKVVLFGNFNLFQVLNVGAHNRSELAWLVVLLGGGVAVSTWTASKPATARAVGLVVGLLAGALAILFFIGLARGVRHADGLATVSYGPWVAVLGCAGMVIGGLMPIQQRSAPAARRQEVAVPPSPAPANDAQERLGDLERLRSLRDSGVLTDEELASEKAKILG